MSFDSLPVLFEDNHLIVVFKAAGLLTQGDKTWAPSLVDLTKVWLKNRYQKPGNVFLGMVHRLDRPCRGVVVFAKTSKGAARLSKQIREHTFQKIYRIVVQGNLLQKSGELSDYISPVDESRSQVTTESCPCSQLARLRYKHLQSHGDLHSLEVELISGRKHQIRVQFAHRGLPILGDAKYGSAHPFENGIALMAYSVSFAHPTSQQPISVTVPTPYLSEFNESIH